ncbi:NAD(P)H-dependent oxidoreductase [Neobacillus sp. PS3-34]|uniref:NAD(P)H-dependent oxidoreductase n=1 Tax=Neobacillus sp. PS3-34 TaxID=3070678 RepID=UPI0027DEDF6A|nr:NAD(P)H-dependent oxidoreductase [Neobacillus sp. PS3-34]WML48091.1 NAD(P)H-dependent oxidoreductase [Neobacillus sp. PS3-34]
MNVLLVVAHPEPLSLNGALKEIAVQELTEAGHDVVVSDLYEMKFKAAADKNDFIELKNPDKLNYILEQYYAFENGTFAKDIRLEQEKIQKADIIIFQYPMWWSDPPAILKGWFDRVISYGFAYGPGAYDQGNLKGKKAMLSITTGGADLNNYGVDSLKGRMEDLLFNVQHEKLYYTGMDIIEPFVMPSGTNEAKRDSYIKDYIIRLRTLETLPVIPYRPLRL